jgi:hypothetical protein
LLSVPFGLGSIKGILGVHVHALLLSALGAVVTTLSAKVTLISHRVASGGSSIPLPGISVPVKAWLEGLYRLFVSRAIFHTIPRSLPQE